MIVTLAGPRGPKAGAAIRTLWDESFRLTYKWEGDNLLGYVWETSKGAEVVDLILGDDLPECEAEMVRIVLHERYPFLGAIEIERFHCPQPHPLIPGSLSFTYLRFYREDASDY